MIDNLLYIEFIGLKKHMLWVWDAALISPAGPAGVNSPEGIQ